ncbi:MAG: acetoacetate decarboxylase family protein [Burkholderiales bacterium]
MSIPAPNDPLRGFAAPLEPGGQASLYGPPPWRFHGRMLTVFLRADPREFAARIPAPLRGHTDPILRVSSYEMVCDYGFGPAFTARHPELAHFRETGVSLFVDHAGVGGHYCAFIWCDGDAEIAVGREMYGWPQVSGQMWLTRPPHGRSWRAGDEIASLVSRAGRPVLEILATLERPGDVDLGLPLFQDFYTMTVLPSPERPEVERRITCTRMLDVQIDDAWSGSANIRFHAPELAWLEHAIVLGARTNLIAWTKPYGKVIHREVVPVGGA